MPKLPQHELLKSAKRIGLLFKVGKTVSCFPIRAKYRVFSETDAKLQVAFSAPKRQFRRAVDRNKMKRRLRESFRLNKEIYLQSDCPLGLEVMFIISSRSMEPFDSIDQAMKDILTKLSALNNAP